MDLMTSTQALEFIGELKNINSPALSLFSSVDRLLNANLADCQRHTDVRLQAFFRAAHKVGIYETKDVADAIHKFMQHCPLNFHILRSKNLWGITRKRLGKK
jgi:hypothetical protein